MSEEERQVYIRRSQLLLPLAALALVAFAAWRASYGATAYDDSHYAATALHLAQGARPFADEMSIQSPGFVLAAPFARLWTALFGMTGLVLALREFYVVLAALVGFAIYRLLRPSFGRVAIVAAVAPLLGVPYNVFGISYNTSALFGFTLAVCLGFAALRDDSPHFAGLAGAATAFGSISYPPLAVGGIVFAATFMLVARRRRLILWLLAGALTVSTGYAVWYFAGASLRDIRRALDYSALVWQQNRSRGVRMARLPQHIAGVFAALKFAAVWVLALLAAVPAVPRRLRGWALAAVPVAAVVPGIVRWVVGQPFYYYGAWPTASLLVLTLGLAIPITARAIAQRGDSARLLLLAAPISAVNVTLVAVSTTSAWYRAIAFIGIAPLTVAMLAIWAASVAEEIRRPVVVGVASSAIVLALVSMLATLSFFEPPPAQLHVRVRNGAFAGIATTPEHARKYVAIGAAAQRTVRPGDRVLVIAPPAYILLAGGRVDTNSAWWTDRAPERATIDYLTRDGGLPDVVFVSAGVFRVPPERLPERDPLVVWVMGRYRRVGADDYAVVFVRR